MIAKYRAGMVQVHFTAKDSASWAKTRRNVDPAIAGSAGVVTFNVIGEVVEKPAFMTDHPSWAAFIEHCSQCRSQGA